MRLNSVTVMSSSVAGSGGAAAGFAIGTMFMPGVGSVIGAVVGGIAGGLVGEKLSAKAYKCIESKIEEVQHMKKNIEMSEIFTSTKSTKCKVSDERFEQALRILGIRNPNKITYRYSLEDIEAAYDGHLDVLTLERSYTESGDSER